MIVGIDFTASNGECHSPVSLHYLDPSGVKFNQYQDVIRSVGSILQPYDSDQMYPVYGFGARVRLPDGTQSPAQHCFPVYGGGYEVHGVEGILQVMRQIMTELCMTLFLSNRHIETPFPALFLPDQHYLLQLFKMQLKLPHLRVVTMCIRIIQFC